MANYSAWRNYTEGDVKANAPTTAGVYLITCYQDSNPIIRYVGQAANLRSRLLDHLSSSETNKCLIEHRQHRQDYCWIELPKQSERDAEESDKIKKYQPLCNTQGK